MVSGTARRLAAAFLLGAAVGAAATVPYYGRRVEALLLTTGSLLQQLHEHRARLARLEEARDRSFRPVIQRVRLELLHDDEAVRLALAERLSPLAEELVGRDLERVDPYLVYAMFDGRSVDLDDARYVVTVRAVVAAPEMTVILTVTRAAGGEGAGGALIRWSEPRLPGSGRRRHLISSVPAVGPAGKGYLGRRRRLRAPPLGVSGTLRAPGMPYGGQGTGAAGPARRGETA
ncbi:MAG: hypothetical protein FWJ62_04270 [Thermaerobacter sp.]|nr:hypothetical protein [Bacillota bacterium]REJ32417.1 MAG: hypothetical protein DIU84_10125 [Bacillota bacterium]